MDCSGEFIAFAVETGVLRFGEFKTKAGRLSPYFFNAGLFSDGASLNRLTDFYARAILGLPFHDVTTGYRLWRRETLLQIPFEKIQSSGYVFLVEMAYLTHCLEFRIGESPIYFADRRFGKSKMSFKIQMEAALRIWQVWWEYRDLRKAGKSARV